MSKYVATIGKVLAICQNDGQNIREFFFFILILFPTTNMYDFIYNKCHLGQRKYRLRKALSSIWMRWHVSILPTNLLLGRSLPSALTRVRSAGLRWALSKESVWTHMWLLCPYPQIQGQELLVLSSARGPCSWTEWMMLSVIHYPQMDG